MYRTKDNDGRCIIHARDFSPQSTTNVTARRLGCRVVSFIFLSILWCGFVIQRFEGLGSCGSRRLIISSSSAESCTIDCGFLGGLAGRIFRFPAPRPCHYITAVRGLPGQ